jgi:hypothetical protein
MTRSFPLLAIAFASALAAGCEPSFFAVHVEATEVCLVELGVAFPGLGPDAVLETSIVEDELGLPLVDGVELDIELSSVTLAPAGAMQDLTFIDRLSIELDGGDEESELPPLPLVELGPDHRVPGGALYGEPPGGVDVTAYVEAGELFLGFELAGDLPSEPWQATMDLCLDIEAAYVLAP